MAVVGEAFVAVRPDPQSTKKFSDEARTQMEPGAKQLAGDLAGIFGGAFVAQKGLSFIKDTLSAADSARVNVAKTEAVIKSTGGAANVSADQVAKYAAELSDMSGQTRGAVRSTENLLLTFTQVKDRAGEGNDIFRQATETALNMSVALGTDASGSAIQLGKALNDPITGLTALRRVGVSFTEQQQEQIKTMVRNGDLLGAQKVILAELNKEFGGMAEAAATPAKRLEAAWSSLKSGIGSGLLPVMDKANTTLTGFINGWKALPAPVTTGLTTLVAAGAAVGGLVVAGQRMQNLLGPVFVGLRGPVDSLGTGVMNVTSKMGLSQNAAATLGANMGQMLGAAAIGVGAVVAGWTIWNAKIHETDKQVSQITGAVESKAAAMSLSEVGDYIGKVRDEAAGLDQQIKNSSAPWDADFRAQLRSGRDELNNTADAIENQANRARTLSAMSGLAADEVFRWVVQEDNAGRQYSTTDAALAALTGTTGLYALNAKDAAAAAASQAEGLKAAREEMLAAVNPYFAASKSAQDLADAQENAAVQAYLHGVNSKEALAANEAQAQAAMGLESSLSALAEQMKRDGSTTDDMRAAFQRWVDQGWITQDQADKIYWKFDMLKGKAEEYTGNYTATVDLAGVAEVLRQAQIMQDAVNAISGMEATVQFNARSSIYNDPDVPDGPNGRLNLDNNTRTPMSGGGYMKPWSTYQLHDTTDPEVAEINGRTLLYTGSYGGRVRRPGNGLTWSTQDSGRAPAGAGTQVLVAAGAIQVNGADQPAAVANHTLALLGWTLTNRTDR